jgi:hypothetical protein
MRKEKREKRDEMKGRVFLLLVSFVVGAGRIISARCPPGSAC